MFRAEVESIHESRHPASSIFKQRCGWKQQPQHWHHPYFYKGEGEKLSSVILKKAIFSTQNNNKKREKKKREA